MAPSAWRAPNFDPTSPCAWMPSLARAHIAALRPSWLGPNGASRSGTVRTSRPAAIARSITVTDLTPSGRYEKRIDESPAPVSS